jgi:tRNA (cmo5U34)-methyltransferase
MAYKKKLNKNNFYKLKIKNNWVFDKNVSKVFDKHVRQSIPFYNNFQKHIVKISEFYLKDNSVIYDIGCSTGNFILELNKIKTKNLEITGIDQSRDMIKIAESKTHKIKKNKLKFIQSNIFKINLKKSDLIICSLMLPFFSSADQKKLLKKIFDNLKTGGAAIFLNKSICNYSNFENIFNQLYYDFKIEKGISPSDVYKKSKSLRSVHTLNSTNEDLNMLKKIGFKKIDIFFKYLNFTGFIVEK